MSRLKDLEREVQPGDVLLIQTKEKVTLSLQAVTKLNKPESQLPSDYGGEIKLPQLNALYLSACYNEQMDKDTTAAAQLDLETGELYGNHLKPDQLSHVKISLPLHFSDYEILKRKE